MVKRKRNNSGKFPSKKKAINKERDKKGNKRIKSVPKNLIPNFGQKKEFSLEKINSIKGFKYKAREKYS